MPIETIITAVIMTATGYMSGYMHSHVTPKNKKNWLVKFLMPLKATREDHEPKIPLMVYVNENYETAPQAQGKKPNLKLIEK